MNRLHPNVRILIPAFNAALTLHSLSETLRKMFAPAQIIVCDDGSTDGTEGIAAHAGMTVCRHERNRGKGAALRTAIRKALDDPDAHAMITMDADGQHDPCDIPGFVDLWQKTNADLVIGSRQIRGTGMPLHRRLSNLTTSYLVSARIGRRIPDSQCGFRLLSRRLAAAVVPEADGFEAETEWILRAARAGMDIRSIPVRTIYAGERSTMRNWKTTKAFVRVLLREYPWEG